MNTTIDVMNDASISVSENIQAKHAIVRLMLVAALIGTMLVAPPVQYMIALVVAMTYLFTTAILRWDPLYALFAPRPADSEVTLPLNQYADIVRNDIGSQGTDWAANDSHEPGHEMKKAG